MVARLVARLRRSRRVLARRLLFARVAGVAVVVRCGFLVVLAAYVALPAALVGAAVAALTGPALVPRAALGMAIAMGIPLVVGPAVHEAGHALAGVRVGAGIRRVEVDHRGARVRFAVDALPWRATTAPTRPSSQPQRISMPWSSRHT